MKPNPTRRHLLLAAAGLAIAPWQSHAQTKSRTYRIGILNVSSEKATLDRIEVFVARLAELGFAEGRNLVVERRNAEGRFEALPALAAELIANKPDLIFAPPAPATVVVKAATTTIPIVFCYVSDPVGMGFAKSLAKPGGNLTGLANFGVEIAGKRIEMLKEFSPRLTRLAIWRNTQSFNDAFEMQAVEVSARRLHLRTIVIDARNADEYTQAAVATRKAGAEAVYIGSNPIAGLNRKHIVSLIAELAKPAVYWNSEFVAEGGLISYAADFTDQARRAAGYAARILQGARPQDLPIQQPVRLELMVNLRTARALGLAIPNAILLRADRVIE